MIDIQKSSEPPLLRKHRTSAQNANYDNGPADMKKEIASFLLREQGYICCYCMQVISEKSVRVEHKLSQNRHPGLALDYSNMAGACSCTKGCKKTKQHCDIFKEDQDFTFNLSNIEHLMKYEPRGRIKSLDPNLDKEINEVLNLNVNSLVLSRKKVYEAIAKFLSKSPNAGKITKKIHNYESPKTGKKKAFCGVCIFFLQKRLARLKK